MKALLLILCLLLAAPAFAQHPCDRPEVITSQVTAGVVTVSACAAKAPTLWQLEIDGARSPLGMTTNGVRSVTGLLEFTGAVTLAAGTYQAAILADGVGTSLKVIVSAVPPACVREAQPVKWSSTSLPTLQTILTPLYLAGWHAVVYGNGFLIVERCK